MKHVIAIIQTHNTNLSRKSNVKFRTCQSKLKYGKFVINATDELTHKLIEKKITAIWRINLHHSSKNNIRKITRFAHVVKICAKLH